MWIIAVIILFIFFILAGFFSGMETGLISIDRHRLEQEAKTVKKKKHILKFLENPDILFGTTLFGTNISIVIVSSLTIFLIHFFKKEGLVNISDHTGTLITAGIILIFAEIIPKALYREHPNKQVTRWFSTLQFFNILFTPFVKFVTMLNRAMAKLFHLKEQSGYLVTREDISYMLSATKEEGGFHEEQREMLEEALEFTELKAENVMIHRTEMIAFTKDTPIDEVIIIAKQNGYTRFPVYEDDLDNIIGILIIYDLMKKKPQQENLTAQDYIRPAYFAPETMSVNKLLTEMQTQKKSMAIIVDAYGGTAGLVTIEDILEEIVGEIEDEYDTNTTTQEVRKIDDNNFLVQGFVEIDFLNDEHDMDLPEGDYETIAGLIINRLARIPVQGQTINIENWTIEVIQVTNRKIEKVKLIRNAK